MASCAREKEIQPLRVYLFVFILNLQNTGEVQHLRCRVPTMRTFRGMPDIETWLFPLCIDCHKITQPTKNKVKADMSRRCGRPS